MAPRGIPAIDSRTHDRPTKLPANSEVFMSMSANQEHAVMESQAQAMIREAHPVQPGSAREADKLDEIDRARDEERDPRTWDTEAKRKRDRG
jgi:hypothetical protein